MRLFHKNILAAITLVSVLAAAAACTREALQPGPEGDFVDPSDFEIGWHYGEAINIDTRTEQSVSAENSVTNLYVLLSDQDGHIIHRKSYWVSSMATTPTGYDDVITSYSVKQTEDGEASSGTILRYFDNAPNMSAYSGKALTFYAVANYSDAVGAQLKAARTKEDIENLSVSFTTSGNVNRTRFLMVAKEEGIVLNINEEGKIERIGVNLELKRVDAKIKFNLTVAIAEAVPGTVDFEDMTYRVHRVPNVTYLFPREKGSGAQEDWDAAAAFEANAESTGYSCMLDDNYQTFDVTESDNSGGTFAFYMRENRPVPKMEITAAEKGNFSSLYAMREAWDTDETINPSDPASNRVPVHGRTFKYAPENSTFVEISGNLSYTRKGAEGDEEVFGSVTYIVHLGETGNDPNDQEAVNNYDVRRNVNYNYNMRITGINNFEVEVTTGEEQRPGAEGDITVSTNKQITVDAHYARILFQIDRTSIEQGAGWSVSTPIGEVKYDSGTGLINYPYDYKWVLFAVNHDFGTGSDVMVKFPGIQAYDGGVQFYSSLDNRKPEAELKTEIAGDRGNSISAADGKEYRFKDYIRNYDHGNYYYKNSTNFTALTDNACLRDVNQLINYLTWSLENNPDIFDESGKVAVTAFCDEYTYIYDPRREDYIHPGKSLGSYNQDDRDRRLKLWKEYVNAGNRVMNITPMATTEYSPDGNTSLTNSYITITQNSIKSIYNPDMTETAWGLETTNETGKLTHVTSTGIHYGAREKGQRTNNLYDGRTNFLNFWVGEDNNTPYDQTGSISWTDAMTVDKDVEHGNDLNEDYRNAFYACITRNRDLNGNNLIDANEIFWYLAARDQLTGLWIGQGAIDEEAWMYTGNGHERNHLVTSSHRTGGHYWVLWAEEGASVGGLREGGDENTTNLYDYRCIRNLGIDISEKQAPESYAKISGGPYYEDYMGYYIVDVSVINSRALRSTDDEGINLPLGHERSQNNMPYKSFDVRTSNDVSNLEWLTIQDRIEANNNPCPEGWRVPNQREMLIMMSLSTLNLGSTNLATATSFSFCGNNAEGGMYGSDRYGFYYNEGNMTLASGDPSLNIRCVRDNTD